MIENPITFFSDRNALNGTLYFPDDVTSDHDLRPAVIVNSGYQGVNQFYPRMFAHRLTGHGYICLGFDYRGMADSEGESGRVLIEEQVQDIRNAITFVRSQDSIDGDRIGLVGWGMGAANVILAAERSKRNVAAVGALNGFYDGERWLKSIHSYERWNEILDEIHKDRTSRVLKGEPQLTGPFEHYPLDVQTEAYVETELWPVYGFSHRTQVQFTESIIDLKAEQAGARLSPIALFIAHGIDNLLHPYSEAEGLYESAQPPKTLFRIEGKHNDFMYSDHPEFILLCKQLGAFLADAFERKASASRMVSE